MKHISRITLMFIAASLLIGLSACSSLVKGNSDAEKLSNIASDIADFDLPAGFKGVFSGSLAGYSAVGYSRGSGPSHIYLIQSEKETDGEKLAEMLSDIIPTHRGPQIRGAMKVRDTRTVTVRGQETTLVISEGINSEGLSYRQAMVTFPGNNGPALLVFSESIANWDEVELDNLLASIQ